MIVSAVSFLAVFKTFTNENSNLLLISIAIIITFAALFFIVHYISKYFEYDSDGVKVVVRNKGLLLSDKINYRESILEFDKKNFSAYKFKNYFFYKTLTFYIKDRKGKTKKHTFNVTLVTKKKRRYIRQSLNKMIKMN